MSSETISIEQKGSDDGGLKGRRLERIASAPVVLEARDVRKTFRHPDQKIESFKERAVHPFRRQHFRELKALNGVDLDVRQGEFFGIVGRNGSGKSTLLKILASIYARRRRTDQDGRARGAVHRARRRLQPRLTARARTSSSTG